MRWAFPHSDIVYVQNVETCRATQPRDIVTSMDGGERHALSCARMVLVSEWAKLDVACYNFYADVYEHSSRDDDCFLNIEK